MCRRNGGQYVWIQEDFRIKLSILFKDEKSGGTREQGRNPKGEWGKARTAMCWKNITSPERWSRDSLRVEKLIRGREGKPQKRGNWVGPHKIPMYFCREALLLTPWEHNLWLGIFQKGRNMLGRHLVSLLKVSWMEDWPELKGEEGSS